MAILDYGSNILQIRLQVPSNIANVAKTTDFCDPAVQIVLKSVETINVC